MKNKGITKYGSYIDLPSEARNPEIFGKALLEFVRNAALNIQVLNVIPESIKIIIRDWETHTLGYVLCVRDHAPAKNTGLEETL